MRNEPSIGNVYTGVQILPTLSTIHHINILMSPVNTTQRNCMDAYNSDLSSTAAAFVTGKWGNAINPIDSWTCVPLPDNSLTRLTSNFTISFWVNPSSASISTLYSNYSENTAKAGILIWKDGSNKINFRMGKNTGTVLNTDYKQIISTTAVSGTWAHVACVWDGTTMRLYINGTQEDSTAWANAPAYSSDYNYHAIGTGATDRYNQLNSTFNGKIDDFAIFTKALSAAEVTELQSAVLTSTSLNASTNLLAYYPFDSDVYNYALTDLSTQREATIKFYANQSTTPYMTKYVTRADIYKGYVSFEINKSFINSLQMEIEYYNSTNLNNNGTFTQLGICDFSPFYAELIYEPTTTLK